MHDSLLLKLSSNWLTPARCAGMAHHTCHDQDNHGQDVIPCDLVASVIIAAGALRLQVRQSLLVSVSTGQQSKSSINLTLWCLCRSSLIAHPASSMWHPPQHTASQSPINSGGSSCHTGRRGLPPSRSILVPIRICGRRGSIALRKA